MFNFGRVFERDIDFLIMRNFVSSAGFAELFLGQLGIAGIELLSIEHSLTDTELGESDITIKLKNGEEVFCLLIEDKIDADAMPEQYRRYVKRANKDIANGTYSDYAIFITAPEAYLAVNKEAQKYPHRLSYETMRDYFRKENMLFEAELLEQAITKQNTKPVLQENEAVTAFWNSLYEYAKVSNAKCGMHPVNGAKGSRSLWVQFKVSLRGAALFYKSDKGAVDLEFTGKSSESKRIKDEVNPYKHEDMHWWATGNSLSLRIETSSADFSAVFDSQKDAIDNALRAVERLTALAVKLNDMGFQV